jgi:hypothetical protein
MAAADARAACVPTTFGGLTAAVVNPTVATGFIDATGCDIGIYVDSGRTRIDQAEVSGATAFGVVVNGDLTDVAADVVDSWIHDIGDSPFTGAQRGVGIYYRAFISGSARGRIAGNTVERYQKGGIVTNGRGTAVQIMDNEVRGLGPTPVIAQNGIQVGYGASASVMRNTVEDNAYTGTSTVSGGITIVGGGGYGLCPDGNSCPYTVGTQIVQNIVRNNDIGVFITNLAEDFGAPAVATNIKATNNTISSDGLKNFYGGIGYQAGVSDVGNNDKIVANRISGAGYDPLINISAYTVAIDADESFTTRPKVHANSYPSR